MNPTETSNKEALHVLPSEPVSETSPNPSIDNFAKAGNPLAAQAVNPEEIKALLAEARNTKQVLEEFQQAVDKGSFPGSHMKALALGLSFVGAVLAQTRAHVKNLQERLEK